MFRRIFFCLCLAIPCMAGCNSVQVKTVRTDTLIAKMRSNILVSDSASPRTIQWLRQHDLEAEYKKKPLAVLQTISYLVRQHPDREACFVLAELCHANGRKYERWSRDVAFRCYIGSVTYSYFYLFDEALGEPPSQFDPNFRLSCDLYNRSLAKCIALAQKQDLVLKDKLHIDVVDGGIDVEISHHGFAWRPEDFGKFKFASDYEVIGLDNHFNTYGLGVPLIAIRNKDSRPEVVDKYYPRETSVPVTAFLRMNCKLCDHPSIDRAATLELYDPLRVQSIAVAGRQVPLESDLTTPLGYYLAGANLEKVAFEGLLRGEIVQSKAGLYVGQPYEPGKIPVIFVHGLWSSPLAWMPMFNDLQGDPQIRDKYQFWFFLYPTGSPFAYSAGLLRQRINEIRRDFDPQGKDPALNHMVLVGHSMGGLVSKMMAQSSQDQLWNLVSSKPFDQLQGTPDERGQLQRVFFFEPQPFVERIVFIATPHKGSELSKRPIGRISSALISLPRTLAEMQSRLLHENPNVFRPGFADAIPTSVENLAPDSPILKTVASLPIDPHVIYHSIIGDIVGGDPKIGTDGVVEYSSSHIEGAASEYIVPADHTCQNHPRTILEVRRILLQHLEATAARQPIQRASLSPATELKIAEPAIAKSNAVKSANLGPAITKPAAVVPVVVKP